MTNEAAIEKFLEIANSDYAVELIARKYLLLWWSFCVLEVTFYSLI